MESSVLSQQEIRRYQKLINLDKIGLEGAEKIKNASVLVVGAGALGAPVLQYLTSLGVGIIGILDNDVIEEKNLPGQILFGTKDLGKQKAIISRDKLQQINHLVKFNIHNICLSPNNALGFCQEYDIIVDATDNFTAKYLINDACVILKKPWVYGVCREFEGSFTVFSGKTGPTLRCLYPERPINRDNLSGNGEIGMLTGVTGSLLVSEVVKLLTNAGEIFSGQLCTFNLLNNQFSADKIETTQENLKITSII
jgi:sulfur-carrier protein adenylyltransferase/sulfurtransferase